MSEKKQGSDHHDHGARAEADAEDARARLEQMRQEGGGMIGGFLARVRVKAEEEEGAPPLDWRMTPRNIILQLLAILLFLGVAWFLIDLFINGVVTIFS